MFGLYIFLGYIAIVVIAITMQLWTVHVYKTDQNNYQIQAYSFFGKQGWDRSHNRDNGGYWWSNTFKHHITNFATPEEAMTAYKNRYPKKENGKLIKFLYF